MSVSLETLSVLLVEPSTAQYKIIENHFKAIGVRNLHWAKNGSQALHVLDEQTVDLVVNERDNVLRMEA